ncbi:MAG: hypothetical protein H6Q15_634 [Bacteroidetes bacterium]|nr:hypothetical protein [Bacteroidota bacterium]
MPFIVNSQVTVTSVNTQKVKTVIENNFLGGGVTVSNVRFNGDTMVNSNQFGTFYNGNLANPVPGDTMAPNVGLRKGLVMVTGDVSDASAGTSSGTQSSTSSPTSNDVSNITPLINVINASGLGSQPKNDIASLSFNFITIGDEISFRYVFASEEYPNYVCSNFNDVFGFFIDGPYIPGTNTYATGFPSAFNLRWKNIAIIPESYPEQPVTINTVNGGSSAGSVTPCILTNTAFFRTNTNNNCKMNGYTVALRTKPVPIVPCYEYKLSLAICDLGDAAFNSAVFLEGNSFRADEYKLNVDEIGQAASDTLIKGCSKVRIKVKLNRPSLVTDAAYNITIGGNMVEGVDYATFGHSLTIPAGDTSAYVDINFLTSPTDIPGQVQEFLIIAQETSASLCVKRDTIRVLVRVPEAFVHTLTDDKIYCADVLPQKEYFQITTTGGVGDVTYHWSAGDSINKPSNSLMITAPIVINVTATDGCGRVIQDKISFSITQASATVGSDKEIICEGDSVVLSCSESENYLWESYPADISLSPIASQQNPIVTPNQTTKYLVTITDINGCFAQDSLVVKVIPAIKAEMYLNPDKVNFSNPEVKFEDLTVHGTERVWHFGDGETSTQLEGTHVFPNSEQKEYEVMLIASIQSVCHDTAIGKVLVVPDFMILLPSAFTPGSGDANSVFVPITSMPTQYDFVIYNRWGEQIFSTTNPGGWDGKLKDGSIAPNGAYIWYLIYTDGEGVKQTKKGTVNLIKGGK